MINTGKLAGRTLLITGASRGIGKAIALKAARDGANIVVAAKTAEPHPKLPGTIYTAAQEIEEAGGKALPLILDVRDEQQVKSVVKTAVEKFGGIDILVNNASAISLSQTLQTDMKRYDLMNNINTRGTFLVSKECIPYLLKSNQAHILNLSPPLNLNPVWFGKHVAYTIAKYGMSMCVLGMSHEYKGEIGVNALWPKTAIATAAVEMLLGEDSSLYSRKPEIVADAAYGIFCRDPKTTTGNFYIDEDIVKENGVTDLLQYACYPENADKLVPDGFLDVPTNLNDISSQHESKKTGNAAVGVGQVEGLFKKIESHLSKELVQKVNAIYHFNVKGDEAGIWFLNLKDGSGNCGKGDCGVTPEATLTMNSKDFFDMFSGNLKATSAFMSGKLKINGDLSKAMKLEKLMGSLKKRV
ncbi:hydroxysteroid dehydrogenase-like protein 2 [Sitodiplosis mosellana]|uniref:hydroxysteroid dehydrogenase-like protein 2 n=1 Tax=Sitodiplosis mosellana TaxID=263140 RepID=UPI00244522BD|nr:hydroxysteroid dehydrogenase-like protein 2 [Sitodiplosis mosellana]